MAPDRKATTSATPEDTSRPLEHADARDIALAQACLLPSLVGYQASAGDTNGWSEDSITLTLTDADGMAAAAPVSTRGTARAFGYLCRLCWCGLRGQLVGRRADREDDEAPGGL